MNIITTFVAYNLKKPIMKKVIKNLIVTIALLPCLLILNESATFTPNLIGMAYSLCAVVILKNKNK